MAAAAALLLWPLAGSGVSGNALLPHYSSQFAFGAYTYAPLPDHPTAADLRKVGIVLPKDRVVDRRREAAVVLAAGLMITTVGLLQKARRRNGGRYLPAAP